MVRQSASFALAIALAPNQVPADTWDYTVVRADMFAGLAGDAARFAKAMEACERTLARDAKHPEALVWHGSGLFFQAGQAFQRGDMANGGPLWERGLAEMNEAVSLAPDSLAVVIPRGAVLLQAARFVPPAMAEPLLQTGVGDFEHVLDLQRSYFHTLGDDPKGELLFGLADGLRPPRRQGEGACLFRAADCRGAGIGPGSPWPRVDRDRSCSAGAGTRAASAATSERVTSQSALHPENGRGEYCRDRFRRRRLHRCRFPHTLATGGGSASASRSCSRSPSARCAPCSFLASVRGCGSYRFPVNWLMLVACMFVFAMAGSALDDRHPGWIGYIPAAQFTGDGCWVLRGMRSSPRSFRHSRSPPTRWRAPASRPRRWRCGRRSATRPKPAAPPSKHSWPRSNRASSRISCSTR